MLGSKLRLIKKLVQVCKINNNHKVNEYSCLFICSLGKLIWFSLTTSRVIIFPIYWIEETRDKKFNAQKRRCLTNSLSWHFRFKYSLILVYVLVGLINTANPALKWNYYVILIKWWLNFTHHTKNSAFSTTFCEFKIVTFVMI